MRVPLGTEGRSALLGLPTAGGGPEFASSGAVGDGAFAMPPTPSPIGVPAVVGLRPRKLLSLGHSYVVTLNRRLPHEMARVGGDRWDVTAVAPESLVGDLRPLRLDRRQEEPSRLEGVPAHFSGQIHIMLYGHRLKRLLRGEPWDLVHCWEEPYVLAGGQVARWTPDAAKLVYYSCQNNDKRYPPPFSWIEQYSLDRCDGWIGMGRSTAETLLNRGYDRRPHRIFPLGVDVDLFFPDSDAGAEVRTRLGWSAPGPPVVGFLGRFVPEKGLALLMRSLDAITTPWRALFVGTGPMEGKLSKWAKAHGDRVRIVTTVQHGEVPAYLNAMDLLAAPSQTMSRWREQFGRMLIEAFACGVPVVASDSGEIPFVVADAGRVIPEADQAAWTAILSQLLESPEVRADLSRKGRERVMAHFTWPLIARGHLEFFSELLENPSPSRR